MARPKSEQPRRSVTYKLPPELLAKLKARASETGCSMTVIVQRALEAELRRAVAPSAPVPAVGEAAGPVGPAAGVVDRASAFRLAAERRRS